MKLAVKTLRFKKIIAELSISPLFVRHMNEGSTAGLNSKATSK
jgi:hypothetical protein